jgi:hypothetical protein
MNPVFNSNRTFLKGHFYNVLPSTSRSSEALSFVQAAILIFELIFDPFLPCYMPTHLFFPYGTEDAM